MIKEDVETLISLIEYYTEKYTEAKMIKYKPRYKYNIDLTISIDEYIPRGKSYLYYYYRDLYNSSDTNILDKCALFIFLNKTCFRGLYREGKNGFNVPFGNYVNPKIIDPIYIRKLHHIFNKYDITFSNVDFSEFLDRQITRDSLVYLDPPYYPLDKKSFTTYNKGDFSKKDFETLLKVCNKLNNNRVLFIHSNSFCEYNTEQYVEYFQEKILCKRRINSKNPNATAYELIIYNRLYL